MHEQQLRHQEAPGGSSRQVERGGKVHFQGERSKVGNTFVCSTEPEVERTKWWVVNSAEGSGKR